jgi:hypothetical protein
MLFNEFYGDEWRDKVVTHRTPTGRTTRVKVGSLPSEEQLKYNPNRFKGTKADTKMTKNQYDKTKDIPDKKKRVFDVYLGTKNLDLLDDIIEEDKLILATNDSSVVIDLFDDDLDVAKLTGVPVEAIKKYLDGDLDDVDFLDEWEFKDAVGNEEELYELAEFSDAKIFLIDLYPYRDVIDIKIDKAGDDEDDFEELKKESFDLFRYVELTEEIEE